MVGLRWSGHYNGSDVVFGVLRLLPVVVWILRWLDCSGEGTKMVGLRWSGHYNGSDVVFEVLRRLPVVAWIRAFFNIQSWGQCPPALSFAPPSQTNLPPNACPHSP